MTTLLLVLAFLGLYLGLAVATARLLRSRAVPGPVMLPVRTPAMAPQSVAPQSMARPRT
jgi:hypothetical protein